MPGIIPDKYSFKATSFPNNKLTVILINNHFRLVPFECLRAKEET